MLRCIERGLLPISVILLTASLAATVRGQDRQTIDEPDAARPRLMAQSGHRGSINAVAFSPDARLAITGSDDKTARLWEVASGRELRRLEGHTDAVTSVAFSPDGRLALTGSRDMTVRLWNTTSGREIRKFQPDSNAIGSVAFSPDGTQLLAAAGDCAWLWSAAEGNVTHIFRWRSVTSAMFSPNGQQVFTCGGMAAQLWNARTRKLIREFEGNFGGVVSLGFSPDGAQVLAGCRDGTARLWSVADGHTIRDFNSEETGGSNFVALSPDGNQMLTFGWSGFRSLDTVTGVQLRRFEVSAVSTMTEYSAVADGTGTFIKNSRADFEQPESGISSAALSLDGKLVLTGHTDGKARIWTVNVGHDVRLFKGHADPIHAIAISRDRKRLFTVGNDVAQWWDAETGQQLLKFDGHYGSGICAAIAPDNTSVLFGFPGGSTGVLDVASGRLTRGAIRGSHGIASVAFSPNGKQILVGSGAWNIDRSDHAARLCDAASGNEIRKFEVKKASVVSVAISPDGKQVLTGSDDEIMRLWDVASGREIRRFKALGEEEWFHGGSDTGGPLTSVAFSQDGKHAIMASRNGTVRVWDAANGKELGLSKGSRFFGASVALSPDGEQVAFAGEGNLVTLWNDCHKPATRELQSIASAVATIAVSPEGDRLLAGSSDGAARLWDLTTGRQSVELSGHTRIVTSVAFLADRKRVFTVGDDNTLRIWDAATGREIRAMANNTDWISSAVLSPDGRIALAASWRGIPEASASALGKTAWLWDLASGEKIRELKGHDARITSAAFSPDGAKALTGGQDDTAILWNVSNGNEIRRFSDPDSWITAVAFSPDGKQVLTGNWWETARLWDVASGKSLRKFEGHTGPVVAVEFSPDGKHVLTGSVDQTARLWNVATGQEIRKFDGRAGAIQSIAFLPDAKRLLTATVEGHTILWDAATGERLCDLASWPNGNWAVFDPQQHYDASNPDFLDGLYWVAGNETFDLGKFKDKFYEPGLLANKMGFEKKPLHAAAAKRN